jgi:probable phosphoglycerate mutase
MSTPVPQPALFPTDGFATEILLIRHGRSADVVPGTPESHDPPLHEQGVAQAAALARRLEPKRIDAVYSSDLARAHQTALPIAEQRGLTVHQLPELREVFLGEWEGGEFRRRAATGDPEWLAWAATGRWDGIPGGEGDAALRSRVTASVDAIAGANEGAVVAIVCHGGVINAYLADVFESPRSFVCVIENTSVSLVRYGGQPGWYAAGAGTRPRPTVITINDCHHLYDQVVGGTS